VSCLEQFLIKNQKSKIPKEEIRISSKAFLQFCVSAFSIVPALNNTGIGSSALLCAYCIIGPDMAKYLHHQQACIGQFFLPCRAGTTWQARILSVTFQEPIVGTLSPEFQKNLSSSTIFEA